MVTPTATSTSCSSASQHVLQDDDDDDDDAVLADALAAFERQGASRTQATQTPAS